MADDDARDAGDGNTDQPQPDSAQTNAQQTKSDGADDANQRPEPDKHDDTKTFTQAELDRMLADRLSRERKKFADYDDLKKKATEFDKMQDAQKSEVEKLNDQLTSAQVELQGYRVSEIRRAAASAAGLDPDLAEFITAADETEAAAQAKRIAERFKPAEPRAADLKQGARPHTPQQMSKDDLLRGLAGYGR